MVETEKNGQGKAAAGVGTGANQRGWSSRCVGEATGPGKKEGQRGEGGNHKSTTGKEDQGVWGWERAIVRGGTKGTTGRRPGEGGRGTNCKKKGDRERQNHVWRKGVKSVAKKKLKNRPSKFLKTLLRAGDKGKDTAN